MRKNLSYYLPIVGGPILFSSCGCVEAFSCNRYRVNPQRRLDSSSFAPSRYRPEHALFYRKARITSSSSSSTPPSVLQGSLHEDDIPHDDEAWNKNDENNHDQKEEPLLVTREMLLRDMLSDPETVNHHHSPTNDNATDNSNNDDENSDVSSISNAKVKRKKKNGSTQYRTLDNRDSLPFLVKVATPDPYTSNEQMKREAKQNTERAKKKKSGGSTVNKNIGKMRHNLVGMDGRDSISSSIYTRADDGSMHKIIGEFALDKSTNCGDVIEIGDGTQYQVQKARCQYKYVGGKRFVMTRKILEVKEIKRILIEKEVQNLFEKEIDSPSNSKNQNNERNDDYGIMGSSEDDWILE